MKTLLLLVVVLRIEARVNDVTTICLLRDWDKTPPPVGTVCDSLTVHGRTNAVGKPFLLDDGIVRGRNVDVDFEECVSSTGGCEWKLSDDWRTTRASAFAQPLFPIGTTVFEDNLHNACSKHRTFLENIEVLVKVEDASTERILSILLDDKESNKTYVVHIAAKSSASGKSDLNFFKCPLQDEVDIAECEAVEEFKKQVDKIKLVKNETIVLQVEISNRSLKFTYGPPNETPSVKKIMNDFKITHYRLNVSGMSAYIRSTGVGAQLFSLEALNGVITSPVFVAGSSGHPLCVNLDCQIDDGAKVQVEVKAVDSSLVLAAPDDTSEDWHSMKFRGFIPLSMSGLNVSLEVRASRPNNEAVHIQRISSCNDHGDESVLIVSDSLSLPPGTRGFDVAKLQSPGYLELNTEERVCRNGGRWNTPGGDCICAVGFNGTYCQEACGANRYGEDCGGLCSQTTRACRGMIVCRPQLDCDCAPGLWGPLCNSTCDQGLYGAGCKQRCGHCAAGTCNVYTGTCHQGCKPGFMMPLCQYTYKMLKAPPVVKLTTADGVVVFANLADLVGDDDSKPRFYQMQHRMVGKGESQHQWVSQAPVEFPTSPEEENEVGELSSLEPGRHYQFRVLIIDQDSGVEQSSKVPVQDYSTSCEVPTSVDFHLNARALKEDDGLSVSWTYSINEKSYRACAVESFEIHLKLHWKWTVYHVTPPTSSCNITGLLPGGRYRVKMRASTQRSPTAFSPVITAIVRDHAPPSHVSSLRVAVTEEEFRVTWTPPRHDNNDVDHYMITYKCIAILACPTDGCHESEKVLTYSGTSIVLRNVIPFARYEISVLAVDRDGRQGPSVSTLATSDPQEPTIELRTTKPPVRDESYVTVFWDAPDNETCRDVRGSLLEYKVEIGPASYSWSWKKRKPTRTLETQATFTDLTPRTMYKVNVTMVTTAGSSDPPLEIEVKTAAPTPGPVTDLVVYKRTSISLSVRWGNPESSSALKTFTVRYHSVSRPNQTSVTDLEVGDHNCNAWPDKHCYTISKLMKNTEYNISVSAKNNEIDKDGKLRSTSGSTVVSAAGPSAPRNLRAVATTSTTISLEWGIPDLLNGPLGYFQIQVEEISYTANPDEDLNHKMINVTGLENPTYSHTIDNLRRATTYLVIVRGFTENMNVGEEAKGTFKTKVA